MFPLVFGKPTSIGMSYASFGLTLIGGMTTATLLTLLVVPVFYTFMDDAGLAVRRMVSRAVSKRAPETPAADPPAPTATSPATS